MSQLSKKLCYILISFFCVLQYSSAQECEIIIRGTVIDKESQSPLPYVNIYIQETQVGTVSDNDGKFILENICEGHFHFIISHIGCEDEKFHFDIHQDTTINIGLLHTPTSLGTVVISGEKDDFANQASLTVKRKVIEDNSNQNFAGILENESGVHLLKNGNGISKPVVHGLFGNRLMILNNGIIQSGQQWGNDHSPEIDAFSLDKITIIKGASVVEYGGANLGSVILSEPKKIVKEPHLHGQVNYIFESNGLGQTINTRIEKYTPAIAWRINGSLKKYGDRSTNAYFLNNTGVEEANLSVQLEKSISPEFFLEFYASTFNTKLGVLRGSHIGNLTDLEQALTNEVPFFTEDTFSYQIDAPRQNVSHHFIKGKGKYFFDTEQFLEAIIAVQLNDRKEFDLRRSGRSDIPALSLQQFTFNTDLKYTNNFKNDWKFKVGNQNILTDNTNNPETGILPLIPDYRSWKTGFYSTLSNQTDRLFYNFGLRYDLEAQTALTISNSIPREIVRFENVFHNLSSLFALKYKITSDQTLAWNIGFATRNPAINELYSNGLHQGVSGIEEGDINLLNERAVKNTLEYKWVPSPNFAFNALAYHQSFDNYIYLKPQDEFRLTIRGAFPVFKYEQTDANIFGLDLSTQFTISNSLLGIAKYSFLRGDDISNDQPLIFMPPNSLFGSLTYRALNIDGQLKNLKIEGTEFELSNRYVFEQTHILAEQDFALPPPAYNLIGLKFSTHFIFPSYKIRAFVKVDNLLNTAYRDYLNRQRYFSNDLGRSFLFGINLKF